MSKYIELKPLFKILGERGYLNIETGFEEEVLNELEQSLPTIEPIEENGIFKGIVPTIEVSDDCISREYMLKLQRELHGWMSNDKNHELWQKIKDAPSAVPTAYNLSAVEDCISRAYAIEVLSHVKKDEQWRTECIDNEIRLIKLLPSVVPSRAEGEWVDDPKNNAIKYCSNCELAYTKDFLLGMLPYDNPNPQMVEPPYCPNCGAKMKGVEE